MRTPRLVVERSFIARSIANICKRAATPCTSPLSAAGATTAVAIVAALQFAPAPLLAADVTWLGGSGNWSPATSWSTGALPTAADHVFVDGGQNGTASAVTVNVAASAGSLTLDAGDVINNTSGQVFSLFGPSFTNNGTFNNGNGAILVVRGTTALSGNGEIVLGTNTSSRIDIDGNHSLTIGAGNVVRGHSGTIGGQLFVAGTATLINDGLIVADGTDGTLILQESAVTNHGTLRATNGGTLRLDVGVSGGVIDANNGVVLQNGMRISDAVLTSANGGALRVSASSANFLDASTIGGQLDMTAGNARERVQNGLVLDGVVAIDNGGILSFEGNQTLGGSGTVEFGTAGAGNRLDLDGNGTTTIGENVTIRGRNGTIGQQINIAGTQTLVNHGVISADEAGGTITLTDSVVTNHGLLQAINGGTLVLSSNVTGVAGGAIDVGAGSVVLQNGVTLAGAINTSGDGLLRASSSSANFLDGVSLTGNLDLTLVNARERVKAGGLILNGGITIDNNAILSFEGNGSLDGNGTVVFGTAGAGNRLDLDGNGTTTIGENITIRGRNGTIGQQINVAGTQTLVNHGVISVDEAGGTFTLTDSVVTNHGLLQAINGGTLVLSSHVTGAAGGAIEAGAGSSVIQNGVTLAGIINTSGDGLFRVTSNSANTLDGVAFSGTLNMTAADARERVKGGGLVLDGTINIDNNAILSFEGTGLLSGTGTVTFGAAGPGNRLDLDGNGTTTIGENITIRGHNGTIGQQINIAGAQTLVNQGLISADVAGGTLSIFDSAVVNQSLMRAVNGGKLVLGSRVNGGVLHAGAGSEVIQSGVTLDGVTIAGEGDGRLLANTSSANFLRATTITGTVDLSAGSSRERVTGGLQLDGRVRIDNGGSLSFEGSQTLSGNGEVVFGGGAGNRLDLDGNGTTTIGAGMTIRGENGTLGGQINIAGTQTLVNEGTILADVAGGTLSFVDSAVVNHGVLGTVAGSTLALTSSFLNAADGVVTGSGTVLAPAGAAGLVNEGHVAPGASPGILTIGGNYTQAASGFLDIDVGSLANSDKLAITGNATLNGTLALHCFASCALDVGDALTIVDAAAGGLAGEFFSVALFGFATGQFEVQYDLALGDVRLVVTEAVSAVPLPSGAWLLLSGLGLLGLGRHRRR